MGNKPPADEFMELAFDSLLANTPDLVFLKDCELRYRGASETFVKMVGLSNYQEIIGKTDYDIFDGALAYRYTQDDRRVLASGIPVVDYVEPLPDKDGRKNYSATSKYLIRDAAGSIIGLYGIGRDVTAQIELEEERERREQGRQMFEDILEADVTENIMLRVEGSRWAKELGLNTGCTFVDAVRAFCKRFIHPDFAEDFTRYFSIDQLVSEYLSGIEESSLVSYQSLDGKVYKWTEFSSRIYCSQITGTLRLIVFLKDLDDEVRRHERLRQKAETDALTGLLNRESTMDQMKNRLSTSSPEESLTLLFIDLDHFKDVNDNLGHPFGDKVLQSTADNLKSIFRSEDIIGRVGGDEFLVMLKGPRSDIEDLTNRVLESIPIYDAECGREIRVTCSIGAAIHQDDKTFEQLYKEADHAMYQAKKSGKSMLVFYE